MALDLNKNNVDKAIAKTVDFFRVYLEESNNFVPKMVQNIQKKRASAGQKVKPPRKIKQKDMELFLNRLEDYLKEHFEYRAKVVLMVDYNPQFELREIIETSGIEDVRFFTHKARFMSKMRVSIYHDKVELSDGGTKYPNIWNK